MAGHFDLRRPGAVLAATLAALATVILAQPAAALVYTYETSTTGTLNAATTCANPLTRTFTVTDSFTVAGIAVGLNVTHPNRGDVQATLVSPSGTTQIFVASSADPDDNYDILVSTNTEGGIDDNDVDPVAEPYYNRMVSLAAMNFYTGNASGTWTLRLCDAVPASNDGTFQRARLVLTSAQAATASCTAGATYDWGANGNSVAFTSTTVNSITFSQTTALNFGTSAGTPNFVTLTSTNGNHTGYYGTTMDAPNTTQSEDIGNRITFTFSPVVRDLAFSLLDVDITGGAWEDEVVIVPRDSAGTILPYTVATHPGNQMAGNMGEGDAAAATTSTDGNLDYVVQGAVSTLTLEYSQGDDPTVNAAFQVVGISDFSSFCAFDFGDAPNTYGTQLAGGARHVVGARDLYLGNNPPDGELDGAPAAAATSDDTTQVGGVDDEDGVTSFPAYANPSTTYTVSVRAVNKSATTAASLVGYIDWNRDGDFADANEISATTAVPVNTNTATAFNVTWTAVPANAGGTTATYARFRIAYVAAEAQAPTGLANSGEVEDYPIAAGTLPVTLASFSSEAAGAGSRVAFTSATETSTVGYRLYGFDGKAWQVLTRDLLPSRAPDSLAPQRYEFTVSGFYSAYLLEDLDLSGFATQHGPFTAGLTYGREAAQKAIDWQGVRTELDDFAKSAALVASRRVATSTGTLADGSGIADLAIVAAGIYRVSYEDLVAAGISLPRLELSSLTLRDARSGKEVALWLQPGPTSTTLFGPGAYFEFRAAAPPANLYSRRHNYRLVVGKGAARVALRDAMPAGSSSGAVSSYTASAVVEKDLVYSVASPNGDPFFEAAILAQSSAVERSFAVELTALAASSGRLRVDLWGVTNWPGDLPDHHVELYLNGTRLVDDRFDGLLARAYDLPLPAGSLLEGANTLRVRVVGDTGFAFDLVHVDGYQIDSTRRFEARSGSLSFPLAAGLVEVDALPSPEVEVFTGDGQSRLRGAVVEPSPLGYRVRFSVPAGSTSAVDVVTVAALGRPAISPPRAAPGDLFTPGSSGRSDYLILSHPLFAGELAALISAREAQGYGVKVVDVSDLYQAYSGGEVDPQAIRRYLSEAARRLAVRMVLLVGGDTYDYLDHLGIGSLSLVPTFYAQTDDLIHFSPADALLADFDGDGLQDLAIGRLPARSRAELRLLIDKTLRYPRTPAKALFAAGRSDNRGFTAISQELAAALPKGWTASRAYVDELGLEAARQNLLAGFSSGAALVNYVGHSGPTAWTFEGLFAAADAASLTNLAPSLVVQWGCWNTYFVSPQYDTLAHRLLLDGPQGAAAVIGSSTLTRESADTRMGSELLRRLLRQGVTVGEALLAAKRAVARDGGDQRDVLVGWTLLGDPALVVEP